MTRAYILFLRNWCKLFFWLLRHVGNPRIILIVRNLGLLLLMPVLFLLMQVYWLCFTLDELLFFRYRRVSVQKPLFILGVPRSGTTFLQRTLSRDQQFTTTTLEECLLSPSILQRYLLSAIKTLLRPLTGRLFKGKSHFGQKMDSIHSLGLSEPEEDFLLLLPILSCFIQMVIFPQNKEMWKLAHFDQQLTDDHRKVIMGFYYRLLQRHLYFHGEHKIYLSKNPSFTSLIASIKAYFPEATVIACVRSPEKTVPSQISSLKPAFDLLGHDITDAQFQQMISEMLAHYYEQIESYSRSENILYVLDMEELKSQLFACIQNLYCKGGYSMDAALENLYQQESERNMAYQSAHEYAQESHLDNHFVDFNKLWPLSGHSRLVNAVEN